MNLKQIKKFIELKDKKIWGFQYRGNGYGFFDFNSACDGLDAKRRNDFEWGAFAGRLTIKQDNEIYPLSKGVESNLRDYKWDR